MSFIDLFRPKWQHSEPEIRAAAVRALGSGDGALLAKIARSDTDASVRRIAIKKIDDPALLAAVASEDSDEGLRRIAGEKLTRILVTQANQEKSPLALAALEQLTSQSAIAEVAKHAADEEVRRVALDRLRDVAAIVDVARGAKEATMRVAALSNIDDLEVLVQIALQDASKEVGAAAVARVDDPAALRDLAKNAKNKTTRRAARDKLGDNDSASPSHASTLDPAIMRRARHLQICRSVEELTGRPDVEKAHAEMTELLATWDEMGTVATDDAVLSRRMLRACDRIRERQAALLATRRQPKPRVSAPVAPTPEVKPAAPAAFDSEADLARRTSLCQSVEELAGDDVLEVLADLKATWKDLGPVPPAATELEKRFHHACEALEQHHRQLREAMDEEAQQREAENLSRLEEVCIYLERYLPGDVSRTIERDLKQAETTFASIGEVARGKLQPLKMRMQEARTRLLAKMAEIKETEGWAHWANLAKLEQLCARAEALRDAVDLKQAAQELKLLQAEWKQVGAAPRDKSAALWQRFRTSCDQIFARAHEHFSQLDDARAENLQKKIALCEQAEALAESIDWKQTSETIKKLQADWKTIGQAPKAEADAVWQRFRGACDQFFARRKAHFDQQDEQRQKNLARKEVLCQEVEKLVESPDVKEAIKVVRHIQTEWRTLGPVPKTQSDAIWKRFREACDACYAKVRSKKPVEKDEVAEDDTVMPENEAKFTNSPFEALTSELALDTPASESSTNPLATEPSTATDTQSEEPANN